MTAGTHDVTRPFAEAYGGAPDGVYAAPGRVNLIGEHTDYNEGFVLPLALPLTTAAAVRLRDDGLLRLRSRQHPDTPVEVPVAELAPGAPAGWAAYPAGVFWALREPGREVPGADVLVDGRVPVGAGLSSSAALESAMVLALDDLLGLGLPPTELARVAQRAENAFVGMPCGILDQTASLLCRAGNVLFLDTRTFAAEQVPLNLEADSLRLLVIDTKAPHRLVDGAYAERRAACEAAATRLGVPALRDVDASDLPAALDRLDDDVQRRRVRHVVTENARVLETVGLLRHGRTREVGTRLVASHASLRDDYEVSCLELDLAVETCLDAGALGARMTGGGFGGSAIALVEERSVEVVTEAVERAYAAHGLARPKAFAVVPSDGARRLVSPSSA